jgi:hypothetical protein
MPPPPPAPVNPTHQQLAASDIARTQLRDSLLSYLKTLPADPDTPTTTSPRRWTPHLLPQQQQQETAQAPLLVGHAHELAHACQELTSACHELSKACHAPPDTPLPATPHPLFTDRLDWIRALAVRIDTTSTPPPLPPKPFDLLLLRKALSEAEQAEEEANPTQKNKTTSHEDVFQLARDLPYFDRALTAYYLTLAAASQTPPATHEYELHVAHSVLRLTPPTTTLADFLVNHLPKWRQQGLLHVLTVAAAHMPSAERDWGIPDAPALQALLHALPLARSGADVVSAVRTFADTAPPVAMAAFAVTLDAIAAIMRVKSNPDPTLDPSPPTMHDLNNAIAAYLPTPDQWTNEAPTPDHIVALWTSLKPALERALPPSMLLQGAECW